MLRAMAGMRDRNDIGVSNLFLAGDYMRMPSMNGALASGEAAAGKAADYLTSRA